ncbi:hypothetical protein [Desemzia sp. FAM 23991]|uniref:hypothetical protein n=1 Tax=unclassified Desemzia TaxID=2685243 RepID=UPI003886861A
MAKFIYTLKIKVSRFMQDRYGVDEYSKFLIVTSLIFILLANVTNLSFFSILGLGFIVYSYVRILSKNTSKRWQENKNYLTIKRTVNKQFQLFKNRWSQRKHYRFYNCPSCKQKIRVPKGKNKIRITCPNCKTQFVKKT